MPSLTVAGAIDVAKNRSRITKIYIEEHLHTRSYLQSGIQPQLPNMSR